MLSQNDPFRELDYLFPHMVPRSTGVSAMNMPMDAYRRGEDVWVHLDLPGVDIDTIDIGVERSVLTVTAERRWETGEGDQFYSRERRQGTFRRQVHLGEALDVEHIDASYDGGVLTLRIPVAEAAKPRRITVKTTSSPPLDVETTTD